MDTRTRWMLAVAGSFAAGALLGHTLALHGVAQLEEAPAVVADVAQAVSAVEDAEPAETSLALAVSLEQEPSPAVDNPLADAAYKAVARLTPDMLLELLTLQGDMESAFAILEAHLSGDEYTNRFCFVFSRMAERDAEAASKILQTVNCPELRAYAIGELAMHWADQDVAKGFVWLESIQDSGPMVDEAYITLMRRYAKDHPSDAAAIVEALEPGLVQETLLPGVAAGLGRLDPATALAWIRGLEKRGVATGPAMHEIVKAWSSIDPASTLDYLLWPDTGVVDGETAIDLTMEAFAIRNPAEAARWLESLPEQARASAAESVAREWIRMDQQGAYQWISKMGPGAARDCAVREVAQFYMQDHPSHAFDWATVIDDAQERMNLMRDVVWQWNANDAERLETAISSAPLDELERQGLLETLAERRKYDRPPVTLIIPDV